MDACFYIKARRVWMVSSFVGVYIWGLIQTQMLDWSIFVSLLMSATILFALWLSVKFADMVMLLSLSCVLASLIAMESQFPKDTPLLFLLVGITIVSLASLRVLLDMSRSTARAIGGSAVGWGAYYSVIPIALMIAAAIAPHCILLTPVIGLAGVIIFSTATHFILDVHTKPKV